MNASSAVTLVGGLGLFLLGIHHLTEGLKGLAGDSLRRALQMLISSRFSAVASGALFTVLSQSSTATTLTVIGFVSAGLITFSQAVGVIIGATFGTTSTPWLVAIFGFRLRISAFAMPMIGVGAFLWIIAKGRTRSAGAILAGFGLLFVGIDYLQTGMEGVSWNLDAIGGSGFGWQWILAGIGILMSIVMQSSSAAAAATLVALNAGSLTFDQACAMIVGQSVGTAATSALVAIGAGLAVRRAALAHIVYNVAVGIIGILLLAPLAAAGRWVGARVDDPDGVLALAAFSSIFKFVGILAFYPWLDGFSRFIERISGHGAETGVSRLDPVLAEAGGSVALEAAWRAILEIARGSVDAVRSRLIGEPVRYDPPIDAVRQTEQFLESLSLETLDLSTFEPRLVRLCHAVDHLNELHGDLRRTPSSESNWQRPVAFEDTALALRAWLDATKDPEKTSDPAIVSAVASASNQLTAACKIERDRLLAAVALQRTPAETARSGLELLGWADGAVYHTWRLAESLKVAAGGPPPRKGENR
ncbi:MAG TPA: Na/Pi symporter [Stellaceae bacterium]|nr:Na/Pi symporter [Stellaceae bacterium]